MIMAVWSPASRVFLRWRSSRPSRSLAIGGLFSAAIVLILVATFGVPVRGTISSAEIHLIAGKAFSYTLPANPLSSVFKLAGDNLQTPDRSTLRVLEDGRQLGPAHTLHADIKALGGGRFSHWGDQLVFSTSDGSSPKTNARVYTYAGRAYLSSGYLKIALLAAAAAFFSSIWLGRNSFRSLMNVITRSYLISHWKTTFIILLVCLNFMLIALYVFAPDAHWSVRPESIKAGEGHTYISMTAPTFAWPYERGRDSLNGLARSNARLYEDGRPLGPSHSLHSMIREVGQGMHSFWWNMLIFSTPDNSDPRTNGRRYTVIERAVVNEQLSDAVILVDFILMLSLVWSELRRWQAIWPLQKIAPVQYKPARQIGTADFFLAATIGIVGVILAGYCTSQLPRGLFEQRGMDLWYDADVWRVFAAISDSQDPVIFRTTVHPIFALLTNPPFRLLAGLGVPSLDAALTLVLLSCFLTTVFISLALRSIGLPRLVTLLFTCVLLASSAFLNWYSVIETFPIGACSVAFAIFVLAAARSSNWVLWTVASGAALAVTMTNWVLAIAAAFFRLPHKRAFMISLIAFCVVAVLSLLQREMYPGAGLFFLPSSTINEAAWAPHGRANSVASTVRSALITTAVAPLPKTVHENEIWVGNTQRPMLDNQTVWTYDLTGWIAVSLWLVLLIGGIHGGWSNLERRAVFSPVALFVLSEVALHTVYGPITFLYSAHIVPALVFCASFGWFSKFRPIVITAGLAFVVLASMHNLNQFHYAANLAANSLKLE